MTAKNVVAEIQEKPIVLELVIWAEPASTNQIEKVQAISKNVVPPELAALWSVANGETDSSEGLFGGYMFTSIEYSCDLMSDYIMLVESDELKDLRFKTAHLGETAIFETGWVPIGNLFNWKPL